MSTLRVFYSFQTQPSDASGIDLAWGLPHVDSYHLKNMLF